MVLSDINSNDEIGMAALSAQGVMHPVSTFQQRIAGKSTPLPSHSEMWMVIGVHLREHCTFAQRLQH